MYSSLRYDTCISTVAILFYETKHGTILSICLLVWIGETLCSGKKKSKCIYFCKGELLKIVFTLTDHLINTRLQSFKMQFHINVKLSKLLYASVNWNRQDINFCMIRTPGTACMKYGKFRSMWIGGVWKIKLHLSFLCAIYNYESQLLGKLWHTDIHK